MGIEQGQPTSTRTGEVYSGKEHLGDEVELRLKPMLEAYFEGVRGIKFYSTAKKSKEDLEGIDGFFVFGENGACRVPVDFTCATGKVLEVKKDTVSERNDRIERLTPVSSQIILIRLPGWLQNKVLDFPEGGSNDPKDREEVSREVMGLFLGKQGLGYVDAEVLEQAVRILQRIYPT